MNISSNRFEFALRTLKPDDWGHFERLSSTFLVSDFPGIRTMASPGGDRGRDAELYTVEGEPNTLFQFSIRVDWDQKIKETLKRVGEEFPSTASLVYMTSQQIGAKGDDIRAFARKQGISLDVRDRSWFVERLNTDDSRHGAAAELSRAIVDPLLETSGIIKISATLEGQDAKTALVFLELQTKDSDAAKGLTKSCFESLVKAALQNTSSTRRKNREEIHAQISRFLPQHNPGQLAPFVEAALKRLKKSAIKHYVQEDEFHISYEEVERTKDRVAGLALLQDSFNADVHDIVHKALDEDPSKISNTQTYIRSIVETYFYRLGEEFAQSVANNRDIPLHANILRDIVMDLSPTGRINPNVPWMDFLYSSVVSLIASPSNETIELFRVLSTAYTLFAFLSAVPDVQRASKKLFSHGHLWFDTSVLLPIVAEQAFPDNMRPFTDLMTQLRKTGLKLWVTPGVLEEIEAHLNLCKIYVRQGSWIGRIPYVYQRYAFAGGTEAKFGGWLEQFIGDHKPIDDLAVFLAEVAGIEVGDLPALDAIPESVIEEVREYWHRVQDQRRTGADGKNLNAYRLAEHDAENYLSVLAQRRTERDKSIIGYTSWLVTIDSAAWKLLDEISKETADYIKHRPIISLDFLLKYLSFGPRRDQVDKSNHGYSRIFTSTIYESLPRDLIDVAQQVRESCHGLSERLIQRRIRDELDKQRMKAGTVQHAGLEGMDEAINSLF